MASTQVSTLSPARPDLLRMAAVADAALLLAAAGLAVFYAPADAVEGVVQKIFYLHVPAAIAAYAAFAIVLVGGFVFLWNESPTADRLARVAAEVGLLFTTVMLVMDADPDEGFIRGKMKGGPLPRGRGLLMAEDTGVFVQVAATEFRK